MEIPDKYSDLKIIGKDFELYYSMCEFRKKSKYFYNLTEEHELEKIDKYYIFDMSDILLENVPINKNDFIKCLLFLDASSINFKEFMYVKILNDYFEFNIESKLKLDMKDINLNNLDYILKSDINVFNNKKNKKWFINFIEKNEKAGNIDKLIQIFIANAKNKFGKDCLIILYSTFATKPDFRKYCISIILGIIPIYNKHEIVSIINSPDNSTITMKMQLLNDIVKHENKIDAVLFKILVINIMKTDSKIMI